MRWSTYVFLVLSTAVSQEKETSALQQQTAVSEFKQIKPLAQNLQGAANIPYTADGCSVYHSFLLRCNGTLPLTIPGGVTEVLLEQLSPESLVKNMFCQALWTNVSKLTISCPLQTCSFKFELGDNVFHCLENLEDLKLEYEMLINFSRNTFSDLQNLISLDLTGCSRICIPAILTAMASPTSLPRLSSLILAKTGKAFCNLEIDRSVVDVFGVRNITSLNISGSSVKLTIYRFEDLQPLCDTLQTLNLSYTTLAQSTSFHPRGTCDSLRTLDVTGLIYAKLAPLSPGAIKIVNLHITANNTFGPFRDILLQIFRNISTLYLNKMLSRDHELYIRNCSIVFPMLNQLTRVELCGYSIIEFDLVIRLTHNQLQYLKLSNNNMNNIGVNVFKYLTQLKGINLANNQLSRVTPFEKTFNNLFISNKLLEEIDLSNNNLNNLPSATVASTDLLERLYLSGNKFQQITFNLEHLANLKVLDMKNNSVKYLNAASMNALDRLFSRRLRRGQDYNEMLDFLIDLKGNPFICTCSSLTFLNWLAASPIFSKTKHDYVCQAGEETLQIIKDGIKAAEEDCERPIRKRRMIILSSVLPTFGLMVSLILVISWMKYRKRRRMRQHFEDGVRLIQDERKRFMVFLSFASEDYDFVDEHILRPLQDGLENICNAGRDIVGIGDRDFRPGRPIIDEMIRCIEDSAVFIAVMSRNYCNSEYCKLESELARLRRKPFILLFKEDVPENDMSVVLKDVFRHFVRIKFIKQNGLLRLQPDWAHVCMSIVQLADFGDEGMNDIIN